MCSSFFPLFFFFFFFSPSVALLPRELFGWSTALAVALHCIWSFFTSTRKGVRPAHSTGGDGDNIVLAVLKGGSAEAPGAAGVATGAADAEAMQRLAKMRAGASIKWTAVTVTTPATPVPPSTPPAPSPAAAAALATGQTFRASIRGLEQYTPLGINGNSTGYDEQKRRHGKGRLLTRWQKTNAEGVQKKEYEGGWHHGKREGNGTEKAFDANEKQLHTYQGTWSQGLKSDLKGVVKYPDGMEITQKWKIRGDSSVCSNKRDVNRSVGQDGRMLRYQRSADSGLRTQKQSGHVAYCFTLVATKDVAPGAACSALQSAQKELKRVFKVDLLGNDANTETLLLEKSRGIKLPPVRLRLECPRTDSLLEEAYKKLKSMPEFDVPTQGKHEERGVLTLEDGSIYYGGLRFEFAPHDSVPVGRQVNVVMDTGKADGKQEDDGSWPEPTALLSRGSLLDLCDSALDLTKIAAGSVYHVYYEGQFRNDQRTGNGLWVLAVAAFKIEYKGRWLRGLAHGNGELTCYEGTQRVYARHGTWENGKPHGVGNSTNDGTGKLLLTPKCTKQMCTVCAASLPEWLDAVELGHGARYGAAFQAVLGDAANALEDEEFMDTCWGRLEKEGGVTTEVVQQVKRALFNRE